MEFSYKGKISGTGNATTRNNEITADDLAILRNYIFGGNYGVLNLKGCNFNAYKDGNNIVLEKGIMYAYGYFGYLPETITIPFIKPTTTQYRFIYAEIDRSIIPNTFKIDVKNNQGSSKIKPTTFRQDYLSQIRTGVFQLPLWRVELNSEGIADIDGLYDVRELKNGIGKVKHTNYTTGKVTKTISESVTSTTQILSDRSKKLATTQFINSLCINTPYLRIFFDFKNYTSEDIKIPNNIFNFYSITKYGILEIKSSKNINLSISIEDNENLVTISKSEEDKDNEKITTFIINSNPSENGFRELSGTITANYGE